MTDANSNRWGDNEPPERNDDQDDDLKARRGQAEVISGIKLSIIGWDRKYSDYENRVASLLYRRTMRLKTPLQASKVGETGKALLHIAERCKQV